jgi:hypothetical protein
LDYAAADTMMTRIAMMRTLHHRAPQPAAKPGRKRVKSYLIVL